VAGFIQQEPPSRRANAFAITRHFWRTKTTFLRLLAAVATGHARSFLHMQHAWNKQARLFFATV